MIHLSFVILLHMFQRDTPLIHQEAFVVSKAEGWLRYSVNDIVQLTWSAELVYLPNIYTPPKSHRLRPLQPKRSLHGKLSPFAHSPKRSHTHLKSISEQCWFSQRIHRGDVRGLHITHPRVLY